MNCSLFSQAKKNGPLQRRQPSMHVPSQGRRALQLHGSKLVVAAPRGGASRPVGGVWRGALDERRTRRRASSFLA